MGTRSIRHQAVFVSRSRHSRPPAAIACVCRLTASHYPAPSSPLPTPFIHQSVTLRHAREADARFLSPLNIHADNWVKAFALTSNPYTSCVVTEYSASEIELPLVIYQIKPAVLLKCTGCVRERSAWRATKRWELRHPPRTPPWRTTSSSGGATSLEMDTRNLAVSYYDKHYSLTTTHKIPRTWKLLLLLDSALSLFSSTFSKYYDLVLHVSTHVDSRYNKKQENKLGP